MNQSTCFSHFEEIVNLTEDLARYRARSQNHINAQAGNRDTGEPMDLDPAMELDPVMDLDPAMDLDDPLTDSEVDAEQSKSGGRFIEEYDGAAKEYGLGKTFMTEFNNDRFSHERVTNLYYPFSSRAEWEFAFFLLRSDLSMAAINTFLSLELVKSSFF